MVRMEVEVVKGSLLLKGSFPLLFIPLNFFAMIEDVVFRQSTVVVAAIWAFEKHF